MSPFIIKELYQQIKRIVGRPLTLIDQNGKPLPGASDHTKIKHFNLAATPSRDKDCLDVNDHPELCAIPIYYEGKLVLLVVTEATKEDIQTIQVIISLADLLIQQFVDTHKPRPDAVDLLMTRVAYRPHSLESGELEEQMAALGFALNVQRVAIVIELAGFW